MARHNYIRALAVLLGVLAAATLVTVLVGTEPAEAAFPGANGKIAFTSDRVTTGNPEGDREIFTMNGDGSNQIQRTKNTTAIDSEPAWSPSGTKIAFSSNRVTANNPTGDQEIFTMTAKGKKQKNRTKNAEFDRESAWSPDGRKIAFNSYQGGNAEIYTMNRDGTGQTNISNNTRFDGEPDWQPNPPP